MADVPRSLRGGSWLGDPEVCRSAYRPDHLFLLSPGEDLGFRVCSPLANDHTIPLKQQTDD